MTGRYFEGDHPELESRLEAHFGRVADSFREMGRGQALVLGGGYGRGEGGVMMEASGAQFSNDLDYFLFTGEPEDPELLAWCRAIEKEETGLLGIDVEIKCLRAESIVDPSRSMMFADLVAGHVAVAGDAGFLERMKEGLDFSRIEPEEATRLLWNRGSGMFFSLCRMGRDEELKFVIRNHAKLKLALGDSWLCLNGLYTPKCRERGARLDSCELPAGLEVLRDWHREGVEFKFKPYSAGISWQELEEQSRRLISAWGSLYLAAERKRMGLGFTDFRQYLRLPRLLHITPLAKNLLLAVRDRLKRGAFLRPVGDYPRASLMRALPCLLGLTDGGVAEAARFLPEPAGNRNKVADWEPVYTRWWSFYA